MIKEESKSNVVCLEKVKYKVKNLDKSKDVEEAILKGYRLKGMLIVNSRGNGKYNQSMYYANGYCSGYNQALADLGLI